MAKTPNDPWKSLGWLLKKLKAHAKQVMLAREVLPPDIGNDPAAVLQWLRNTRRREQAARRHPSK